MYFTFLETKYLMNVIVSGPEITTELYLKKEKIKKNAENFATK